MRWGNDGGGVCRCIMHLYGWGYWLCHCRWANAPKFGGRDSVGGGDIAPMYENRGNVSGWSTTLVCGRRGTMFGRATTPVCYKWANLAGHYG